MGTIGRPPTVAALLEDTAYWTLKDGECGEHGPGCGARGETCEAQSWYEGGAAARLEELASAASELLGQLDGEPETVAAAVRSIAASRGTTPERAIRVLGDCVNAARTALYGGTRVSARRSADQLRSALDDRRERRS